MSETDEKSLYVAKRNDGSLSFAYRSGRATIALLLYTNIPTLGPNECVLVPQGKLFDDHRTPE